MKNYKNISSKEELERLYIIERLPLSEIAKIKGVCQKTMKRAFVSYGINIRGRISSNLFLRDKEWLKNKYLVEKKSVGLIAKESGSTRGNVYSALKHAEVPIRTMKEGVAISNRFGETSPHWKGGIRLAGAQGRYLQRMSPGNPSSDRDGYVMEHRLVMEKQLGRYLTKEEIVHHLDGNGHNNDISNLKLTTRKTHFKDHFDGVKEVDRLKKLLTANGIEF